MSMSKIAALAATVLLSATTAGAVAPRCNLNPGGPEELLLTVPQAGSDFDLGWKGTVHDYDVPGGARFALCLKDCDNTTDSLCTIEGQADQLSAAGRPFAPPIPVVIGTVAVCVQANFANPAVTGTFDVATGDIDATATLNGQVYITSTSNVCPQCVGGVCNGGANNGGACTVDESIPVQGAVGVDTTYDVSISCPPSGLLTVPVPLTVDVTTGVDTQNTLCPGQSDADADDCSGLCNATCTGGDHGGIQQVCCSDDTTKACFPSPITRTGSAAPTSPAWPDPSYPKTEDTAAATLVSVFCTDGAPAPFGSQVNGPAGLPGPVAFILPLDQTVFGDTDADGLPDTFDGCTTDSDCDDDGLLDGSLGPEDTNNDGVVDTGETDPTTGDSDGDGLGDGLERGLEAPQGPDTGAGFVADADPNTTTDATNPDTDGDGLSDGDEDANHNGRVDAGETDPNVPDGPGGCDAPSDCNDNDPCTDDTCPAGVCVFTQQTGAAGAQCELDQVKSNAAICGDDPLDKKTAKAVSAALGKVDGLLAKIATASDKKKPKLIKKAKAALTVAKNKAAKAGTKNKITSSCSATIVAIMTELTAIVGAL